MRSFLVLATLFSALLIGSTALAIEAQPAAAPEPIATPVATTHLHAKLVLPPGWHQQIARGHHEAGYMYGFKLYNPTLEARAVVEVFAATGNAAFDACNFYAYRHNASGSIIGHATQNETETQCGFAWANADHGWGGILIAQFHDEAGAWNVVVRLNYTLDTPTKYWLRDAKIISESLKLERR